MGNLEQQLSETVPSTYSRFETQSSVREYSNSIPVDLLIDIFSRVPSKSIARFHCLSKFWRSILQSSYFTELLWAISSTHPRIFFTLRVYDKKEDAEKLIFYTSPQPQNLDENTSVLATRHHKTFEFAISTPLCGLVLLAGWRPWMCDREIRNPLTGESIALPKMERKNEMKTSKCIYFGYDPIKKQFKVLCMMWSDSEKYKTHWVLTLGTGTHLWRRIECKFQYEWHGRIDGGICINGVLYFGSEEYRVSSRIVSFDVGSEKLGFINIDEEMLRKDPYYDMSLINYKGKLGVYQYQNQHKQQLVLWSLEDAEKHKWSKCVYVLPPEGKEIVNRKSFVGMTCTGELVFSSSYQSDPFYVFYYHLERNAFTRVKIQGFEELQDGTGYPNITLDYVETMMKLT